MGQTSAEKIMSRVVGRPVSAGEIVSPEPELITVHDLYVTHAARALDELGVTRLHAPETVMIVTDHEPVAVSPDGAERQKRMREIVQRFGIKMFFDAGRGGHGHVFPMEMGYIRPGMFILGYDTHVTNFGAVGALGIALVTEISEVLACGSVWLKVPETVRINLHGKMGPGISIRDVSQKLTVDADADLVDYAVVEFGGPGLKDMGLDGRITLCNSPCEIGAKSCIVEPDQCILDYLAQRVNGELKPVKSDADAGYLKVIDYDMNLLEPQVAVPPRPDNVVGVSQVKGVPIHHAFVGSCASGMLEDMRAAARILKGRSVHPRVRLFVTPATQETAARAAEEGLIQVFVEAGAMLTSPGCGPCGGGRVGPTANGEVSINTGTRNDAGRLGATGAQIYLASPLTVAASAVTGEITDPRELMG